MTTKRKGGALPGGFLRRTLGGSVGESESTGPVKGAQSAPSAPQEAPRATFVRASFYLPSDMIEGLRDAVDALSGPPHRLTLNGLARDVLARALADLQREHNGGEPFPERPAHLRPGRVRGR